MANMFLCIMFACMFAQYFYINLNVQILNNAVENLPVALVSSCVDLRFDYPFFDQTKLEECVGEYYDYSLKVVHEVSYSYYTRTGEIDLPDENMAMGVDITLTSSFSTFYTYSKTMFYEIVEGLA
ncbi:MAG: hypothetical protein LUD22_00670 [Coprobacillus sp.]|nr:hypothetical protein [Coprobacillus sp.]